VEEQQLNKQAGQQPEWQSPTEGCVVEWY